MMTLTERLRNNAGVFDRNAEAHVRQYVADAYAVVERIGWEQASMTASEAADRLEYYERNMTAKGQALHELQKVQADTAAERDALLKVAATCRIDRDRIAGLELILKRTESERDALLKECATWRSVGGMPGRAEPKPLRFYILNGALVDNPLTLKWCIRDRKLHDLIVATAAYRADALRICDVMNKSVT